MKKLYLSNEEETKKIGYKLGELAFPGCVICLVGDLGAGKTTLTQSLARGLDIDDYVTSPTFTIVNEYDGRLKLNHFDVYRIGSSDEMYDIGYDEYMNSDAVNVIEWANLIEDIIPDEYLEIDLNYKDEGREIVLNAHGEEHERFIEGVIRAITEEK
ncbi:MAG: tRNA (adenosine(37)-N6)-threonylcarbamoyltransferase complex ATPase subunit type 1 TsaE [Clostridioides sp.]|nr:tRNA (adenosine(37)-N6)-threonylcarbamoyltransferase complex ATPase subunit type 1 TsaE [Clostridioides sp.]